MPRQITLLGSFTITDDGRRSDLLRNAKGCALLAYLIVRGRSETREHLADLLWDARDTASSRRNLRVLLTRVRPYLPGLHARRNSIEYIPQPHEAIDYLVLSDALSHGNSPVELTSLQLYRGELLAGLYLEDAPRFMEWLTLERERLRRSVLDAHRNLCQRLATQQLWHEGAEATAHWLSIDDLDEEALRWRLQFLAGCGQVATAVQAYAAFRKALWDQLGVEPDQATQALAQELDDLHRSAANISLPASGLLEVLTVGKLPVPGSLPANAILPYHRNEDFVGREAALLRIAAAFGEAAENARPPVVALTGIGGLGKTQTAVEFCYRYGRYFTGGVFWLNFSESENVASEVTMVGSERGLGLFRESEKLTLTEQVGRVQRAWQEPAPRLLVFDNCEDEALLEQWLPVTGGCRVLLTSRQGEWTPLLRVTAIALSVLDGLESSLLLKRLAPHLQEPEVGQIAREVGHLPLALHLAGSFLQRYRHVSPATYLAQLRDGRLLDHPSFQGYGASRSPTGHELDVARTYTLSWERLDPTNEVDNVARQLLSCAACLASGEPIPTAWLKGTVGGDSGEWTAALLAEDGLSRLITIGFLMRESRQTVVLHPLLASFTREMSGEQAMNSAQLTVAALMARTIAKHRQREGHLSTLPVSTAHLRVVHAAMNARKRPERVILSSFLGSHLEETGDVVAANRILDQACAVAKEIGDALVQAQALTALASTYEVLGQDETSLQSASQAIALFREAAVPDVAGLTQAIYYQGWAYYRLGEAQAALRAAEEGYALSQQAGLRQADGHFLNLMGVVDYYMLSHYDTAQYYLEESLAAYRESGDRQGESAVLNNLGESARLQGDFIRASQFYEAALATAREIGNHNKATIYLSNLCGARINLGQFELAAADLETLTAKINHNWYGLSEAYRFLAEAYLGQGKTALALPVAQKALALANKTDHFEKGRAWRVLGLVAAQLRTPILSGLEEEELHKAASCFRRSLDLFEDGRFERDRAITLWRWAEYEMTQGDRKKGQAMWLEGRDILARLNLPLMVDRLDAHLEHIKI